MVVVCTNVYIRTHKVYDILILKCIGIGETKKDEEIKNYTQIKFLANTKWKEKGKFKKNFRPYYN